jgi:hypothetical protein
MKTLKHCLVIAGYAAFLLSCVPRRQITSIVPSSVLVEVVRYESSCYCEELRDIADFQGFKNHFAFYIALAEDKHDADSALIAKMQDASILKVRPSTDCTVTPNEYVRDRITGASGRIIWLKKVRLVNQSEATVEAVQIFTGWCKSGYKYTVLKKGNRWAVETRELVWQECPPWPWQ